MYIPYHISYLRFPRALSIATHQPTSPYLTNIHTTMSSSSTYGFLVSQNAAGVHTSDKDLRQMFGDNGGLVVVPYFKLPSYDEPFNDTEGRFPQLEHLEESLKDDYHTDSRYWFAKVLPEKEGGKIEFLAVDTVGGLSLVREHSTISRRSIWTTITGIVTE
jgi:hypothetical protein